MGRPRLATKVHVGGRFDAGLATKFLSLANSNGVSMREALRRLIVQAILSQRIPGVDALDLEQRENEKWGTATPVYDGEPQTQKNTMGKVVPGHPSA